MSHEVAQGATDKGHLWQWYLIAKVYVWTCDFSKFIKMVSDFKK